MSQLNEEQTRSLCIGCGGHGAACIFAHIINNPDQIFDIILLTCDDGGCTGRINKYFNQALQNIPKETLGRLKPNKPALALGDLKNNIIAWVQLMVDKKEFDFLKADFKECLECRTDDMYEHLKCFERMTNYFPELVEFKEDFSKVSGFYLNQIVSLKEKTSFGNLLLQTIYNASESSENFFEKLKNIGLVPRNVNLYFLLEKQLILEGKVIDIGSNEKVLVTEAVIDVSDKPIMLGSYILKDGKEQVLDQEYLYQNNPSLMKLIESYKNNKNSNILFPAGSISNLFPVLNILSNLLGQLNIPIIHISNAFEQRNEEKLQFQIEKIHKMFQGQPLVVFGVSKNPFDFVNPANRQEWLEKYEQESKRPVSQNLVANYIVSKKINSSSVYIPNLGLIKVDQAGLKYPPNLIDKLILKTMENWKKNRNISDFIEQMKRFVPNEYKNIIYPYEIRLENHCPPLSSWQLEKQGIS